MRLFAVVSTYYPDLVELEKNILSYLDGVDYLIVWENTPKSESTIQLLISKLNNSKIELRTTGKNEFLAYPFNECIKWSEKQDFTHILTMDQDSGFVDNQFEEYKKLIQNNNLDDIAIFASTKNNSNKLFEKMVDIDNAITSGSIYNLKIFNKIGYFSEDFLIYMMDIEYGFRVKKNGFRIVCFPEISLNHEGGYARKTSTGLVVSNYSAQSTYYIIRNTLLTWRLYPENYSLNEKISFIRYKVIYRAIKLVLEKDLFRKFRAIFIALVHGVFNKSGRFDL